MTAAEIAQSNELLRRSTVAAVLQIKHLRALEIAAGELSRAGFVAIGFDCWQDHEPTLFVEPPDPCLTEDRALQLVAAPGTRDQVMSFRHGKVRVQWTVPREAA